MSLIDGHTIKQAKAQGWDRLSNGDLLTAAEDYGFDLLVTPDKNMRYQQNFTNRKIALIVIGNAQWPVLRHYVQLVSAAINSVKPGSYTEVAIPHKR